MTANAKAIVNVLVTDKAIDPSSIESNLQKSLGKGQDPGAQVTFVGRVRGVDGAGDRIDTLSLEHYPGMTEKMLRLLADRAASAPGITAVALHHRHGSMEPGEVIVVVSVASAHRKQAFESCQDVVDHLKTDVPFWKKETGSFGQRWVQPAAGEGSPKIAPDREHGNT